MSRKRVIVSLTSWKKRINTVHIVVRAMKNQSVRVDKVDRVTTIRYLGNNHIGTVLDSRLSFGEPSALYKLTSVGGNDSPFMKQCRGVLNLYPSIKWKLFAETIKRMIITRGA